MFDEILTNTVGGAAIKLWTNGHFAIIGPSARWDKNILKSGVYISPCVFMEIKRLSPLLAKINKQKQDAE